VPNDPKSHLAVFGASVLSKKDETTPGGIGKRDPQGDSVVAPLFPMPARNFGDKVPECHPVRYLIHPGRHRPLAMNATITEPRADAQSPGADRKAPSPNEQAVSRRPELRFYRESTIPVRLVVIERFLCGLTYNHANPGIGNVKFIKTSMRPSAGIGIQDRMRTSRSCQA
jgi:hypothetical protein